MLESSLIKPTTLNILLVYELAANGHFFHKEGFQPQVDSLSNLLWQKYLKLNVVPCQFPVQEYLLLHLILLLSL